MIEIRIEKVYDGHAADRSTFINFKQVSRGKVERVESFYPSINSRAIKGDPEIITSDEANKELAELRQYARPYIKMNSDDIFHPMKER